MVAGWWTRVPLTIRVLAGMVMLLPFLFAMPYAMFGHPRDPFSDLYGLSGPLGVLIAARFREPEYWRLDEEGRRRVREVQDTGQPSGDRQVDAIAVARLSRIAEKERANLVATPVALIVMIATPVVAALRTGHEWWLIAALPQVLCLAWWLRASRGEGPRARLGRLLHQMGRISSGE